MPEAKRVFCDMENNFPNFYVYEGYPRDQKVALENIDSYQAVQQVCGKLGLEPV